MGAPKSSIYSVYFFRVYFTIHIFFGTPILGNLHMAMDQYLYIPFLGG